MLLKPTYRIASKWRLASPQKAFKQWVHLNPFYRTAKVGKKCIPIFCSLLSDLNLCAAGKITRPITNTGSSKFREHGAELDSCTNHHITRNVLTLQDS